ncbi:hypothetical protein Pfo_011044, partial [Paulownia fortunei]
DPNVQTSRVKEALFVNSGYNPFELMKNSIRSPNIWTGLDGELGMHSMLEYILKESKKDFREGGCSAKFLIIDDGWQETADDNLKEGESLTDGAE